MGFSTREGESKTKSRIGIVELEAVEVLIIPRMLGLSRFKARLSLRNG